MSSFVQSTSTDHATSVQDFFSEIISNSVTTEDRIFAILEARGFLLTKRDGKLYLSDNADKDDITFLSEGFEKYALGTVIPTNKGNELAEILVSDSAKVEDAVSFFNEKNFISFPIIESHQSWGMLVNHPFGKKVPLRILEPFVARYVKAVSACGVTTSLSCDGNSQGQNCIKIRAEYPFNIWHEMLCDCFIPHKYGIKFDDEGRWYFSHKTKYSHYLKLNQAAEFLYRNRMRIREIKSKACSTITASAIKHLSDEELSALFVTNIRNNLQQHPI